MSEQFLDITLTAKKLGVSVKTLRRWETKGILTPIRTGGNHRRYRVSDVEKFYEKLQKSRAKKSQEINIEGSDKSFLDIDEASRHLGVSTKTLRRWEAKGILTPIRTGGNHRRYSLEHLKSFKANPVSRFQAQPAQSLPTNEILGSRLEKPQVQIPDQISREEYVEPIRLSSILKADEELREEIKLESQKSTAGRTLLISFGTVISTLGVIFLIIFLTNVMFGEAESSAIKASKSSDSKNIVSEASNLGKQVLAASTANIFKLHIKIPTEFTQNVTFLKDVTINGLTTANGGIVTNDADVDAGTGQLTASNVIYSITAGQGIGVTSGQNPTISNTGVLSLQGSTGAVTLTAGSGISISGTTITNTAQSGGGGGGGITSAFTEVQEGTTVIAADGPDKLLFIAGTGITITPDATAKSLTFDASGDVLGPAASTDNAIARFDGTTGKIIQNSGIVIDDLNNITGVTDLTLSGTVHAQTAINTGAGSGTQRIDASGNLVNIGAITASGAIRFSTFSNDGGVLYTNTLGTLAQTGSGTALQCLLGGPTPFFGSCDAGSSSDAFWNQANGTLFANNSTVDLLIGGQSTASAKFAFINVNSGTPTASISAAAGSTYLTAAGNLATTNFQTLNIGGATTGNITFNPQNGSGTSTFNGTFQTNGTTNLGDGGDPINLNGSTLNIASFTNAGGVLYTGGTGTVAQTASGTSLQCLIGGASPSWGSCSTGESSDTLWSQSAGFIYPNNSTVDFGIGGQATNSAKFAILNVNTGTPIASLSAITTGLAFNSTGSIQSLRNGTLTIGGSTTGNIILSPLNNAGNVGINNTNPAATLDITGTLKASSTITFSTFTSNGGPLYTNGSGVLAQVTAGTNTQCLLGGTTPSFGSCGAGIDAFWNQTNGALYPNNSTVDLLVGAQSTASATFAVTKVNSGNASVVIDSNDAAALVVGANGATNPVLKIDASTASVATGLQIKGAAAAGGLAITTLSSGTDEGLSINAKGAGQISLASTNTGVTFIGNTSSAGGLIVVSPAGTSALIAGPSANGASPTFRVISGQTSGTGINITGASAGSGVAMSVLTTGTNENLKIDTAGTGDILMQTVTTGNVGISNATPRAKLDITGSASMSANLSLRGAGTAHTFNTLDNGTLNFQISPGGDAGLATAMFINSRGNVGIGTTSPTTKLDVNGTANISSTLTQSGGYAYLGAFNAGVGPTYPRAGNDLAIGWNFSGGSRDVTFWNTDTTPASIAFDFRQLTGASAATTIMTLLGNGNVGIGTAAPGGKFEVNNTGQTIASSANAKYNTLINTPDTLTITGTTQITGTGTNANNAALFNQPTLSLALGQGVTQASNVYINGAVIDTDNAGIGSSAITESSALRIGAGSSLVGGHGEIVRGYGLYVDAPTGGDANYAATFATGNVGIGTTSPAALTDIKTATNRHFAVRDNASGTQILGMIDAAANYAGLLIDGSNIFMNSASGGNVGIGQTSAAFKLDVNGDVQGKSLIVSGSGTYQAGSIYSDANYGMIFRAKQASPSTLEFLWTNSANTTLMGLTTGSLTISSGAQQAGLVINSSAADSGISLTNSGTGGHTYQILTSSGATGVGQGFFSILDATAPAFRLTISPAGALAVPGIANGNGSNPLCFNTAGGAVTYATVACTASSQRFKHDITSLSAQGSLDELMQLRPVSFVYNADFEPLDQTTHVGFVAEEIAAIDPRLVTWENDGVTPHGVQYENMVALLTGAVQVLNNNLINVGDQVDNLSSSNVWNGDTGSFEVINQTPSADPFFAEYQVRKDDNSIESKVGAFANIIAAKVTGGIFEGKAASLDNIKSLSSNIGDLTSNTATVSGTLFANKIVASEVHIGNTNINLGALNTQVAGHESRISFIEDLLDSLHVQDIATGSGSLTALDNLMVSGSTSLNEASIVNNLTIGNNLTISDSSINTTGSPLEVQPLVQGGVNFLGGKIRFDTDGKVHIEQDTEFVKNVSVGGVLSAKDIAATGSATFNKINLQGSAGTATMQNGSNEIIIGNSQVTANSLIYITPIGTSDNQVLYLKSKSAGTSFTVGMDSNASQDIKFNWIIVN